MHFWIDKRSQACGFGRARVSASLSGAGSAGGLGFAHPPRRISGYKSSSLAHPSVHRQQHAQQHHQHHHNHHQHQQQQHQHLQQSAATHSSGVITTTADCHARNSHQRGIINNNNIANNSSNIYAQQQQHQQPQPIIQQQQQTFVHNMNNNAHLQMQQQQQQQQLQSNTCPLNAVNNCSNTSTYNLLNNNNNNTSNVSNSCSTTNTLLPAAAISTTNTSSTTATTTAVLTGAGTIVPVATNIVGAAGRYGRHQYRSNQYPTINMSNQQQAAATAGQHHTAYDTRSYHHPQFGNMSVRHYQYATSTNAAAVGGDNNSNSNTANITYVNAGGTSSSSSPSLQQMQQNNVRVAAAVANPHPQFSAVATQSGHVMAAAAGTVGVLHDYRGGGNSTGNYMQQPTQQQQHLHSPLHHVCGGIAHAEDLELSGTTIPMGPMHTRPMHSHHATTHRNMSNGNMRATITHNGIIDDADTQPMITQLRCGMWASLILASVFVAGAKFYFDNQGTGLEVIIFCAFSATFFLAACTVSLCRLPKGLVTARHMAGGNNRGILTNNQSGGGGVIVGPTGIAANSRQICGLSNNEHLHELQERTAAAQAGPPPYHIAILLPENSKEVPTVSDESPPPSYDKILI